MFLHVAQYGALHRVVTEKMLKILLCVKSLAFSIFPFRFQRSFHTNVLALLRQLYRILAEHIFCFYVGIKEAQNSAKVSSPFSAAT